MKKILCLLLVLSIFITLTGCLNKDIDNTTTTTSTTEKVTEGDVENSSTTETTTQSDSETSSTIETTSSKSDEKDTTTTTKKSQSNLLISDEDLEKIENSEAEVFFTDNPDNEFIVAVSEKYGAKKENLVALVKVNAEFPSATVFEFSGKKDSNGELVMTYEEFKFIYEIDREDNSIIKASKNGFQNDGVSFVEAKVYIFLAKNYLIPELPNLKANKPYIE